jgi:hypothetical protein
MFQLVRATRLLRFGLACPLTVLLVACGGAPASAPTVAPAVRQAELPLMNEAIDTVTQVARANGWTPFRFCTCS